MPLFPSRPPNAQQAAQCVPFQDGYITPRMGTSGQCEKGFHHRTRTLSTPIYRHLCNTLICGTFCTSPLCYPQPCLPVRFIALPPASSFAPPVHPASCQSRQFLGESSPCDIGSLLCIVAVLTGRLDTSILPYPRCATLAFC